MKKVIVDFSAHISVVVEVKDGDSYLGRAAELAERYVRGNSSIKPYWELDDGGIEDADDEEIVDVKE